jgi:murein DD-endopeptidase MepM/ murein hydrolase activator NlpD
MSSYTITRPFTSWHTGIDLAAPSGTPVLAANGGVVIFAGWNSWGYGNTIVLSHGPFTTLYGHLSSINVGCRQVVNAGQVIGGVGSSGNSSGPHLHFEIRYLDVPTNPASTIGF